MHYFTILAAIGVGSILLASPARCDSYKDFFPEDYAQISPQFLAEVDAYDFKQGKITLDGGMAQLDVPEGYYFLGAKDARYLMEKVWKNPEDTSILGMIFPRNVTPYDGGSWAVSLQFEDIGYVSDDDAESYDYDDMLKSMQADAITENEWRVKNGFAKVELLGWAAEPHYDKAARKVYWAKKLHFDGETTDTLNYNIRALGRKGVLVMNFIAGAEQMAMVETAAPDVMKMASFTEGNRYVDFVPGADTVAAVGIGGLIAGTVASKSGFLLLALAFLKKGFILLLVPAIWLKKKLFGAKPES